MQALWQSFLMVLVAELGDKTQLLALMLAVRFRRPMVVMAGILLATVANHSLATWVGEWIGEEVAPGWLRPILALVFLAFGVWALIPDRSDDVSSQTEGRPSSMRVLWLTASLFFMAEMGDKTQLATVALAARFRAPVLVLIGTTLGMLVADGAAVFGGEGLQRFIPRRTLHVLSGVIFVASAFAIYFGW